MDDSSQRVMRRLRQHLEGVAADLPGRLGYCISYPDVNLQVEMNSTDWFPSASLIKVPIMVEVFRQVETGRLSLQDTLQLSPEAVSGGSGMLQFLHPGLELSVHDAVELMIGLSDNTATNLLLTLVTSEAVNATMEDLHLANTRSAGLLGRANAPEDPRLWSRTTPRDMTTLLTGIALGTVVSPKASRCMLSVLQHQQFTEMLPRCLPLVSDPSADGEHRIQLGHKTGALDHFRADAGILRVEFPTGRRTVVISAFAADLEDGDLWTVENIGVRAVASIGRAAYDALVEIHGG
jgi:beta-lactamase class A